MKSGNPQLIRQFNQDTIRNLIFEKGPITKALVAQLTNLSVPTVSKIVDNLEASGLVCQDAEIEGNVGRRAKSYKINKDAANFIVLFFLRGSFTATLTDYFGCKIAEKTINLADCLNTFEDTFNKVCSVLDDFLKLRPIELVRAIGLGIPGVVRDDGIITQIPSIPSWNGIHLERCLAQRFGIPIFVENDVKLMTVGYYHRELIDRYENMVLLYISEGLGAGIIINRKLYKGFRSFAGEYGFMQINGNRTEKKRSDFGTLEITLKKYVEKIEKGKVLSDAENNEYFDLLSVVVANFIAVINPEAIAIRGAAIDERTIRLITEEVKMMIPEDCMPEMIPLMSDSYGLEGVIRFCQASVGSKISVIDQRGI